MLGEDVASSYLRSYMLEVSFIQPIAFVGALTTACLLPMRIADGVVDDVKVRHALHDC